MNDPVNSAPVRIRTPPSATCLLAAFATLALALTGCEGAAPPGTEGGPAGPDPAETTAPSAAAAPGSAVAALAPEQEAFWARLQSHCGEAYPGEVSDATPYYRDNVTGRRAVMHVMECSEDRIHIPFHLDDNASRNWILTRAGGTLRLKHDHRHPDGTEEEISQYGGDAPVPGLSTRQIFPADAHTSRILPERHDNFWFFDFVDAQTLQYGVHWPTAGHSVRFSFDLSSPVAPPSAPWGYESPSDTRPRLDTP